MERLDALTPIKEGATYAEFYCPVCKEENFKITLTGDRAGAFRCWSNSCNSSEIREALGGKTVDRQIYVKPKAVYNSVPFAQGCQFINIDKYDLPATSSYWSNKYGTRVNRTEYTYSPECRTSRIDFVEDGKKRKQVYPQHWLEGEWCYGASPKFPFYNSSYLLNQAGIVFVVEGEKTATIFTDSLGWLALSPPGFGWTEEWLKSAFQKLYWAVEGVFVLPDNDRVGQSKAWKVQQACWSWHIPCEIIELPLAEEGEDAADLIQKGIDVRSILLQETAYFLNKIGA